MTNLMIRIVTLATCSIALTAAFSVTPVVAAPGIEPGGSEANYGGIGQRSAYPPSSYPKRSGSKATHVPKAKKAKQSLFDDPAFAHRYRAAYSAIYDRTDYASAIEQLKTLGHDDHPNVANLIGYSYRKLGHYKLSRVWYERALKADPNHVLTWQYYGLWQIEQGNRDQAQYHLSRIAAICGTGCEEYRSLAAALEKSPGTSLVY
ncbi:lipopolysaccharide assembly protein LapB [Bradyrhizobium lablabi]|uniref:tetratricopeptide repeat protein n=1 Tax=Bradyrhizobium lablabi TaxID=722472 RepID=UPI001BAD5FC5|nr:tetratricopeptide repeat protein [Bradyrhizobium lablabi]MBR0695603.1 tetratricopeptide repeat protein [Bradyrhizobium lablabi]